MPPFRPGFIVHVYYPRARTSHGVTLERVRAAADTGLYRAVEIAEVTDRRERESIRRLVEERDLTLAYWVSMLQVESSDSISDPDERVRARAVARLVPHVSYAAECGARSLAIVPGRDVGARRRPGAIENLRRSILELDREARAAGVDRMEMETMDREAHKKHVLGPTDESVAFITEVRREVPGFGMVFDTSHIRLLGEDPAESLRLAAPVISRIHFANCVPDPGHPQYGDHHMPLGVPGYLDANEIERLLRVALEVGALEPDTAASIEVAGPGGEASDQVELDARQTMTDVLDKLT